jgi:hypothetical protein
MAILRVNNRMHPHPIGGFSQVTLIIGLKNKEVVKTADWEFEPKKRDLFQFGKKRTVLGWVLWDRAMLCPYGD